MDNQTLNTPWNDDALCCPTGEIVVENNFTLKKKKHVFIRVMDQVTRFLWSGAQFM